MERTLREANLLEQQVTQQKTQLKAMIRSSVYVFAERSVPVQ